MELVRGVPCDLPTSRGILRDVKTQLRHLQRCNTRATCTVYNKVSGGVAIKRGIGINPPNFWLTNSNGLIDPFQPVDVSLRRDDVVAGIVGIMAAASDDTW